jgi:EmrB/QacA subfamily drug resistance transporter
MSVRPNPKAVVCIVYVAAMFMAAMDATIVNVALRTIGSDLQVPPSAMGTLNIGYLVSLAVFLPLSGWLGDRWGTKRVFLIALGIFTGASALCGLADSVASLTVCRVVQGAGGGLLTPVGMAMLFRTFAPQERAKVSRALVLPIAVAPALGPIVGGVIVDAISWRWIFYFNLPVGIAALLFGMAYLKEHVEPEAGKFDALGFWLSAPGFAMAMYALSQGAIRGWSSPEIIGTGLCGAVLLAMLVRTELRVSEPMLNLRLLGDRLFRTMGLISLCSAAGLLGMLYVFPLMYQDVLKASALETGLTTFPEALGLMVASQIVPWSYQRIGPRRLIAIALLCAAFIFVMLSMVGQESGPWYIRSLLFGVGLFLGHAVGAVQVACFANIPPALMGRASTLFTVQNRLGSAIGVAVLAGLLAVFGTFASDSAGAVQASAGTYRAALLGAAAFLAVALLFALRIRDTDAAATMRERIPVKTPDIEPAATAGK